MDLYSTTLLAAMILAGVAAAAAVAPGRLRVGAVRTAGIWLGAAGLALLGVSFVVHLTRDHGPHSPEPMRLAEFLRIHPAYAVVVIAAVAAVAIGLRRSGSSPPREDPTSEEPAP